MRPLRLEVEGFACYRDRQAPLDLAGLSLFSIAGPTGSGKSTILDAMLYALFGTVPRSVGRSVAEFVSHGRDVLWVAFDFHLHGRTYRVVRSLRKGKRSASNAALSELTAAGERSLADTVTEVDTRIRDLVGLDFDAFTQTVILPQNEFARFLQSKPKEQRAILQHLLQHAVYERMRAEAARRKEMLDRDLRGKLEQLEPLEGATPDALLALEATLQDARTERAAAEQAHGAAAAFLQDVTVRRQLTLDLERCRATAVTLEAQGSEIAALERELGAARAASVVMPLVEVLERARQRQSTADEDVALANRAVGALRGQLEAAQAHATTAERAATGVETLRALVQQLDEIRGDLERRPGVASELARVRKGVTGATRRVEVARVAADACRVTHEAAVKAVSEARQAFETLAHGPEQHGRLDAERDVAVRAHTLGKDLASLAEQIGEVTRQHEAVAAQALAHGRAEELARSQLGRARLGREGAERARLEGVHLHAAADLRQDLTAGKPCPVCDQVVTSMPTRLSPPELAELDAAVAQARALEATSTEALQQVGRDLATAEATGKELAAALLRLHRELEDKRAEQRNCLDRLLAALSPATPMTEDQVLSAFESRLVAAREEAVEWRRRQDAWTEAAKAESAAALALAAATSQLREAEQTAGQIRRDLDRLEVDLQGIDERIASVTTATDPGAQRAATVETIATLERNLTTARATMGDAAAQLAAAQARLESLERALADARCDHDERRAAVGRALGTHGFESTEAVSAAARSAGQVALLEQRIRQFYDARSSNAARLAELRTAIEGREVDADTVEAASRRAREAEHRLHAAVALGSRLELQVDALRRDVDRAQRLSAEAGALRRQLAVTTEMALDLRTDGFQDYLLEEAFRDLVDGASTRLQQMSRRYTMEWRDGEFYVVDHDNAGERRRAETLSGGETFMASLCLALQLSDEVLHASGALRMDSLFIDEGFGTLDTQSLAEVTDALENLRQDGERMVGVISHRPELTERLPGCIRVEKGIGESSWILERVG